MEKALVGQTFLSAGSGDFPVAGPIAGLESPANPQAGKPALRSADIPVGGFWGLSGPQFLIPRLGGQLDRRLESRLNPQAGKPALQRGPAPPKSIGNRQPSIGNLFIMAGWC